MIGPLDQKQEPKSLQEIAQELGTFPFTARAVADVPDNTGRCVAYAHRAGEEAVVRGRGPRGWLVTDRHPHYCSECDAIHSETYGSLRRWILLGHK